MADYHYLCSKCDGRLSYLGPDGEKVGCDCKESVRDTEIVLCGHKNFRTSVDVTRLEDIAAFCAEIRINCIDCGMVFRFKGCPGGWNLHGPTISPGGTQLTIPIEPISPIVRKRPE